MPPPNKGGRQRTGVLVLNRGGTYSAKYWTTLDGAPFRKTVNLDTTSKVAAKHKLARLLKEPGTFDPKAAETFRDAAERIMAERPAKQAKDEGPRLRKWVYEEIGRVAVTAIRGMQIRPVLLACKKAGLSKQTVQHVRQSIRVVFEALVNEGVIEFNPAAGIKVPFNRAEQGQKKPRAVLTDAELQRYLNWTHPIEAHSAAVLERQTMSVVARVYGGLRTGELHALTWDMLDAPNFKHGRVEREKTGDVQRLAIPAMLRPCLKRWWKLQGGKLTGAVFGVRRGERAGERRAKHSHARAFRIDLRRAFGLEVPDVQTMKRKNGRRLLVATWKAGRAPTARERLLLEGDARTLPVDFHSWRRATAQALKAAGVNIQKAAAVTHHKDFGTHGGYLDTSEEQQIPAKSLPAIVFSKTIGG